MTDVTIECDTCNCDNFYDCDTQSNSNRRSRKNYTKLEDSRKMKAKDQGKMSPVELLIAVMGNSPYG